MLVKKYPLFIFGFLLMFSQLASAQSHKSQNTWKTLRSVFYQFKADVYVPKFSPPIKALDGKTVSLSGYIYPFETKSKHRYFVLSYHPIKSCFFCGGAGPETVVEVYCKKPIRFTEKKIVLQGRLKLNKNQSSNLFYTLEDAVLKP